MKSTNREAAFLLRRAEEEAIRSISSDEPCAAAAHQELAVRYSERALQELADEEPPERG